MRRSFFAAVLTRRAVIQVLTLRAFRMARRRIPLPTDSGFPKTVSSYSAPVINPPSQRHLYENKMHNLGLVRDRMQGLVIAPGEYFSFWKLVGLPDEAHGFREASMFMNRRVGSAIGGGICQLSGVIYNAALLAGAEIIERHAHSIDAYGEGRYIPLGRDATVAYGYKDLAFRNILGIPLLLIMDVAPDRVTVVFRGSVRPFRSVEIEVEEGEFEPRPEGRIPDPAVSAPVVEAEGSDGRTTMTRRLIVDLAGVTRRELVSTDRYLATPRIVRVPAGVRRSPGEG